MLDSAGVGGRTNRASEDGTISGWGPAMPSCGHRDGMLGTWMGYRIPELHGGGFIRFLDFVFSPWLRDDRSPAGILLAVTRYIRVRDFVGRRDPPWKSFPGSRGRGGEHD